MKFTENFIKGLKSSSSDYRVFEKGADKGFGVKITPAGSVSFFVQYAADKKRRFFNLGRYPSVSLSEARDKCRKARTLIDTGIDPQNQVANTTGTVQQLFDYYVAGMKSEGKRSWKNVEQSLLLNCSDILRLPASNITPSHIKKILHTVIYRGSLVQSNRIRAFLHRAFAVGMFHDNSPVEMSSSILFNITVNPVSAVPNNVAAENVGERVLSFDELARLWNYEGPNLSTPVLLALKMIIAFGGLRSGEVSRALFAEFDFAAGVWSMPPDRLKTGRKTGRWHLLPITPLCEYLILSQKSIDGDSPFLFPNKLDKNRPQSNTAICHAVERFCERECFPVFTARDLRRTVKTRMGELGIEKSIRDRIQNHALADVSSKHYDRWDYMPEKRAALEIWCNALSDLTERIQAVSL